VRVLIKAIKLCKKKKEKRNYVKQDAEMEKEKQQRIFTGIELIIVIAIMAILVGILAPQFIQYVESIKTLSTDVKNTYAGSYDATTGAVTFTVKATNADANDTTKDTNIAKKLGVTQGT
jgi:Tfp pilus assembly protein PilE